MEGGKGEAAVEFEEDDLEGWSQAMAAGSGSTPTMNDMRRGPSSSSTIAVMKGSASRRMLRKQRPLLVG